MKKSVKTSKKQEAQYNNTIGYRLRSAMEKEGYTNMQLAEALGCSDQTISNYINNTIDINKISFDKITQLCKVLGIDYYYLLGEVKDYSSRELETVCKYTGLSEKTAKMLHDDNMKSDYSNPKISELLSELFDNTDSFIKLLYSLEKYIIYSVCDFYRNKKTETGIDLSSELYKERLEGNILRSSNRTTQYIENIVDESTYNEYIILRAEDIVFKPYIIHIKDVLKSINKKLKPSHPAIKRRKKEEENRIKEHNQNHTNASSESEEIPF